MKARLLLALALLSLIAACGDLPTPFIGNPGATARRLAVPITPMLAIPPASNALLTGEANRDFAGRLAESLQKEEVPALARDARKTDWRLGVTAEKTGDHVTPRYAIFDPAGKEQGAVAGAAFPAAGWASGEPAVLTQATDDAVPKILSLMMSIRATRDRADPNSLLNRIPQVYVPEVTGAPGDGNQALTRLIRARLKEYGPMIQTAPDNPDFTVKGEVSTVVLPKGQQRVEIVWTVTRPNGGVSGKVSQLNSIPAGTLDVAWGDVAVVVAHEAAGGIHTVIDRFTGKEPPTGRAPAAAAAAPDPSKPAAK